MNIKFRSYIERDQNGLWIEPENQFEESVFKDILGNEGIFMATTYANGVNLTKMPKEIREVLNRYYKRKEKKDLESVHIPSQQDKKDKSIPSGKDKE